MQKIFSKNLIIPNSAIDANGHVNNVVYIQWMQDIAIEHSSFNGFDMKKYREIGFSWVIRSHYVEYFAPAFADEELLVFTWVHDMQRIKSTRRYKFIRPRDNKILAKAETLWVFVNNETGNPAPIIEEIRKSFELTTPEEEP